ncbi:MAG TPA: hypothetical protein VGK53_09180 [Propionicimonas sp.]
MTQLPTDVAVVGTVSNYTPAQHADHHNEAHRLHDLLDAGYKEIRAENRGITADNLVTDNRAAIAAAIAEVKAAGGGTLDFGPGVFGVSVAAHPADSSILTAIVAEPLVRLRGVPGRTVIKFRSSQPDGARMLVNANPSGSVIDDGLVFEGITFDGNANSQGSALHTGPTLFRAKHCRFDRCDARDFRGTSGTPPNERFHFELVGCADVVFDRCRVYGTAGSSATGFSADASTGIRYLGCTAHNMSVAHGFTHNNCRHVTHVGCWSYLNAGIGFNSEVSDSVTYDGCLAGGRSSVSGIGNTPYADGASLGNGGHGYVINYTTNIAVNGCTGVSNGGDGLYAVGNTNGVIAGGEYAYNTGASSVGISMAGVANEFLTIDPLPAVVGNTSAYGYNLPVAGFVNLPGKLAPSQIPAVPASNAFVTNTYPTTVDVLIIGGTYSAVFLESGGTSVGTPTMVRLRPQQQLAITYTVAPTWRWDVNAAGYPSS